MTGPMGGTAIQAPHRVAPYDRVKGRDGVRTTSCSGAWSLTRSFSAILYRACIERCPYSHQYTSSQYMPLYRHNFFETSLDMPPITVCRWNCCCDIIVKDAPTRAPTRAPHAGPPGTLKLARACLAPSNWLEPHSRSFQTPSPMTLPGGGHRLAAAQEGSASEALQYSRASSEQL